MDLITQILLYVGAAITFATFALQGLAAITRITPSTRDDELVGTAQRYVKAAQRILGMIALDTGSTHKPKGPKGPTGSAINTSLVLMPILLLACLVIGGCASAPPAPQTPRQAIAYTESTFTAAALNATSLHQAGMLDDAQEARLDELINRGNAALVAAHAALENGEPGNVQSQLAAVDAVLLQVRDMIAKESTDEE